MGDSEWLRGSWGFVWPQSNWGHSLMDPQRAVGAPGLINTFPSRFPHPKSSG